MCLCYSHTLRNAVCVSIYIYIIFIIQCVKARAIPCPHQLPTRGDNTVSEAQCGATTPGATKQLLPPDRVYIYICNWKNTQPWLNSLYKFISAKIIIFVSSADIHA